MSLPPEQQRVRLPLRSFVATFVGQPDIGELTRYDHMIENCPDVALSPHIVSTVPRHRWILEDVHASGRDNIVLSLDIHPTDYQYFPQARPAALTRSSCPSRPPPQTRGPQAIDDSSAVSLQTSSSSSLVHSSINTPTLPMSFANNWSLDPQLQKRASAIMNATWFISNGREPRLHEEELVWYGLSRQEYSGSLFDQFIDTSPKYGCLFFNDNGQCPHQAGRPGRARSHAYNHFSYAPFACDGHCGKVSCPKRFTSDGALNGHCSRQMKPTRQCPACQSEVTVQNFSRHMKNMHK